MTLQQRRRIIPLEECLDIPEQTIKNIEKSDLKNWILWPIINSSFDTVNYDVEVAPSPPDNNHLLGTDDQTRDVVARIIYGFRLSVFFAFLVTFFNNNWYRRGSSSRLFWGMD